MKTIICLFLAGALPCMASFDDLFTLGKKDGTVSGFSGANRRIDDAPGSSTVKDDHFYLADEVMENFESGISSEDPRNLIYFPLTQAQAKQTGLFKITVNFIGNNSDIHEVTFSLNGNVVHEVSGFIDDRDEIFEVPLTNETVLEGLNTLTIERSGGTDGGNLLFDAIEVKFDPDALADEDGDQIPRFWEGKYQFSDYNAEDAAADPDRDQLSNLEEFRAGTNPRLADTDGDGLLDNEETQSDQRVRDTDGDGLLDGEETVSRPDLWDTDGDGVSDSFEVATGFDPSSASSTPPAWGGGVGINFRSKGFPGAVWSELQTNGLVPQIHWNHTRGLKDRGPRSSDGFYHRGDLSSIEFPQPGTLLDSAGNASSLNFSFEYNQTRTLHHEETLENKLLAGFLLPQRRNDPDNPGEVIEIPASVTFSEIPFSNYDLYIYVSCSFHRQRGTLRLNGDAATDFSFSPVTIGPEVEYQVIQLSATQTGPYGVVQHGNYGNVLVFENLTGASQKIEAFMDVGEAGIAAVQLVDRASDADNDDLPDYWELRFQTDASTSSATLDLDGDGLDNAAEFALGSDPRLADTDGDGLDDAAERAAGTNPRYPDTDRDGVSDYDELFVGLTGNPLDPDSDQDGLNDRSERDQGADPLDPEIKARSVATYPDADHFLWEEKDIHLIIDHANAPDTRFRWSRVFYSRAVRNMSVDGYHTMGFSIAENHGRLEASFGMSASGIISKQDGEKLDYTTPEDVDLYGPLGFSRRGSFDVSDPFTFRVQAVRSEGEWQLNQTLINQRTGAALIDQVSENVRLHPTLLDQSAVWGFSGREGFSILWGGGYGVRVFRTKRDLHSLPEFAPYRDSDNDGMTDVWEMDYGLDSNSALDADSDLDNDGLSNADEFDLGTLPNNRDSDGDGVSDRTERDYFSNPNLAQSVPRFLRSDFSSNTDLNGNGFPDVWETHYGASGLLPGLDSDQDGHSNVEESILGTNPLDSSSSFLLQISSQESGMKLSYPRLFEKSQTLLSSSSLSNFETHANVPTMEGNSYSLSLEPREREFFQVLVTDRDSDADGLSDWEESILGTSAHTANSLSRPVPYDLNQDGTPDGTVSGDYAAFLDLMDERSSHGSTGSTGTEVTPKNAARLLMQASFGPTLGAIHQVQEMGIEEWIDDQTDNQPATHHRDYIEQIIDDYDGPQLDLTYHYTRRYAVVDPDNLHTPFARAAVMGPDQLRQRVAFALSQIFVVSRQDTGLLDKLQGLSNYYDILVDHAFGNYEDLLFEITMNPVMGYYLSSLGNQKADPEINRFPDENYAREIQQLFSIGLWELNLNGTRRLDDSGKPIPTYNNDDITEFARVFTGLWYGEQKRWGSGGASQAHFVQPMQLYPDFHDFEAKQLLNGVILPKREPSEENGLMDIRDTVRHLVDHPNCAPFVSKLLIQFLVTSNPSPAYVERVSRTFLGEGTGRRRGDLKATVKAILMDPEARDPKSALKPEFGLLREPVIRGMHLARVLNLGRTGELLWWDNDFDKDTLQAPLASPTVFNFFRPDYSPRGVLADHSLVGPAFGILNSYTSVSLPNRFWTIVDQGFYNFNWYEFPPDFSAFLPFVHDPEALVDQLNLVVCAGAMSAHSRAVILEAVNQSNPDDEAGRIKLAIYLAFICPDGAVQL